MALYLIIIERNKNLFWGMMIFNDHIFKGKVPFLGNALNAYSMRNKAIAENIANVSTPGYSPKAVKFEELFSEDTPVATGITTDSNHIPIGQETAGAANPEEVTEEFPLAEEYFSGENQVNIDKEMAALAENQIRFRFASRALKKYFAGMSNAILGQSRY